MIWGSTALLTAGLALHGSAAALEIRGRLLAAKGSGVKPEGAVIWLEEGPRLPRPAVPRRHAMRQVAKKFSPALLAVARNDSVDFENLDNVFHNVFSLDKRSPFDLGLYKGKKHFAPDFKTELKGQGSTLQAFAAAGKYHVFCNIHPEMTGAVYVFDHASFAVADADGLFVLPVSGEGSAVLAADSPALREPVRLDITIKPGMPLVEFLLSGSRAPRKVPHTRKDGKPYPETGHY